MTHLITDHAIEFIQRHQSSPFFAYVAHECPHFPFQGPNDLDKSVTAENWMEKDPQAYVAMLEDLDAEVGRILNTLDQAGVAEKTIVVFVSDNGGFAGAGNMGALNGSKGTTLEGGIRVPMIVRWPDRIAAGTESDQVCLTFDLTASLLKLAGANLSGIDLDGIDIISHVADGKDDFPRTLFWRGRRGERTWSAVREGNLKYVRKEQAGKREEWLYDLSNDIGETDDLASRQDSDVKRMRRLLADWDKATQAKR